MSKENLSFVSDGNDNDCHAFRQSAHRLLPDSFFVETQKYRHYLKLSAVD